MSAVYDSVAQTRPRVRRDVLFTDVWDGVLFHNSSGGFRIESPTAYKLAGLLIPHLNGSRTVAELCARLPEPQREMVGQLVSALLSRELARDIPAGEADPAEVLGERVAKRFAAQIGYIDHFVDRAPQRFAAFRDATAAVIGDGPIADACATGLIRNGMARVAMIGKAGGGGAAAEAAALEAEGVPATVDGWHPAGSIDGPATPTAGSIHGPATPTAGSIHGPATPTAGREPTWPDLADADVVLIAGGDNAPRLMHRLLAAGVPDGKVLVPAWRFGDRAVIGPATGGGHRACWYCAMLRLTTNDTGTAAAGLWRGVAVPSAAPHAAPLSEPLSDMLGNLLAYEVFRLLTGALPAETDGKVIVQDIDSLDVVSEALLPHPACVYCPSEPIRLDTGALTLDAEENRTETADDEDARADAAVAAMSALAPLLAPHAGVFSGYDDDEWDQTPVKVGTVRFTDPDGTPRRISGFDLHHVVGARMRALARAAVTYAERVTAAPDTGTSLVDGRTVALDRARVQPFGAANAALATEPTRAGAGGGTDQAAAVRDALGSALAFAALRGAIDGAPVTQVTLDSLDDAELRFLAKSAANLGVIAELLDLGTATPGGAHTLLARCNLAGDTYRRECAGKLWTVAADPSWRTAAVRALCDLLGQVQLRRDGTAAGDGADPVLTDFDPDTLSVTGTTPARADAAGRWSAVLEALAAAGIDPVAVPIGGADLPAAGLHTVRVVLTERRAA